MAGVSQSSIEIPLADIEIGPRLRVIDPDHAAMLAESYGTSGQLTPVEIRPHPDAKSTFKYRLTAGGHRMAAAKLLNWETIRAEVKPCSEAEARLREIDENLCRHELTELDRSTFLAERKRIWLELHPETGRGKRADNKRDNFVPFPAFAVATAEKLGVSKRTVDRAVRRAEALDPQVRERIAGTPIARRASELDALCKQTKAAQRKIVDLLLHPKSPAKSVAAAAAKLSGKVVEEPDPAELQFRRLLSAWNAATSVQARRRFISHLDAAGELAGVKKGQKDQAA